MSIALFAIIGAKLGMGAAYWILYGVYCATKFAVALYKLTQPEK